MHDEGVIYRSKRLVNWSCSLNSAISDIEVGAWLSNKTWTISLWLIFMGAFYHHVKFNFFSVIMPRLKDLVLCYLILANHIPILEIL